MNARRRQHGLGLLEVLIALVVVSLGVLGMAGLQLTGMKHSSSGFNRSKALLFAENMAVRMRINEPGVAHYAGFDSAAADAPDCAVRPDPYCQTSASGAAASCDAEELAGFDQWSVACGDWGAGTVAGEGVVNALPAGRLRVECGDAACATYTISVEWREASTTSSAADAIDAKRVQLRLRP